MGAATRIKEDDTGGVDCTSDGRCPVGSSCITVRSTLSESPLRQCFWFLYPPATHSTAPNVTNPSYSLNPTGEWLEFHIPPPSHTEDQLKYPNKVLNSPITWSGTFAIRTRCGDSYTKACKISDCRAHPENSTSFMCDPQRGFFNPSTLAEMTFQGDPYREGENRTADYYDIGVIDAPSLSGGLAWIPDNNIPPELLASAPTAA